MHIFNPTSSPSSYKKLIESQYFRSAVKHFNKKQRLQIANQFLSLISKLDIENLINEVFEHIPSQWAINPTLQKRIINFLQSKQRITTLEQICKQALQKNFRRK